MALSKAQKEALDAKREEARLDEKRQQSADNYLNYLKAKEDVQEADVETISLLNHQLNSKIWPSGSFEFAELKVKLSN